ncbi:MAG: hypothetical protein IJM59_14245 [Proteobacteria bacterium]|nr:hypothetical protein [Pseudomonadota bacterium]
MFSLTDFVNGAFKVNHTDTLADVITTALIGILSSLSLPQPIIGAVPGTGKRAKAKCDVFNTISKLTKRTHAKKGKTSFASFCIYSPFGQKIKR